MINRIGALSQAIALEHGHFDPAREFVTFQGASATDMTLRRSLLRCAKCNQILRCSNNGACTLVTTFQRHDTVADIPHTAVCEAFGGSYAAIKSSL